MPETSRDSPSGNAVGFSTKGSKTARFRRNRAKAFRNVAAQQCCRLQHEGIENTSHFRRRYQLKFVHFANNEYPEGRYGQVLEDGSVEILMGGLLDPVESTGRIIREEEITRYLPPINPPNILAMALNYHEHVSECREETPPQPLLFIKATSSLAGHGDNIVLPKAAPEKSDYEGELCVIISRRARNVSTADALDYVFGYTCGNDISARDCQANDGQWSRAKSFDSYAPMGPYVVTHIDPSDLRIQTHVNGEMRQNDSTKNMVYSVPTLISHLSQCMTLLPGTVIMTGTPGGVGNARVPPVFLRPGDICEVTIQGIGTLKNKVTDENREAAS